MQLVRSLYLGVLHGVLAPAALLAGECIASSGTRCVLACEVGREARTCEGKPSHCALQCRLKGDIPPGLEPCRSGSGSECRLDCEGGRPSLVCTRDGKGCKGRCSAPPSSAFSFTEPGTSSRFVLTATTPPPGDSTGTLQDELYGWFLRLVADVYDALGPQRSPEARPSVVAQSLFTAVADPHIREDRRAFTSVFPVPGDEVTLRGGATPTEIEALRSVAGRTMEELRSSRERQRSFDEWIIRRLEAERTGARE